MLKIYDLPSLPPPHNIGRGFRFQEWRFAKRVSTEAVADVSYSRITWNLNTPNQSGLFTCAGLLSIFCRVTVSLSDGCESDSSSPSPPSDNKAPSSLRAAHNQVSWSCDAIKYLVHQPTTMETSVASRDFFLLSLFLCLVGFFWFKCVRYWKLGVPPSKASRIRAGNWIVTRCITSLFADEKFVWGVWCFV